MSCLRALRRGGLLLVAALAATVALAGVASASTIVYQCGQAVCAIDPGATHPAPRQLTANGRLAGVTRDGTTAAWVDPSGALVKAPVAGGAPQTVFTGGVYNEPQMSPDGSAFLWWYPYDSGYGPATFVGELTPAGQFEGLGTCFGCTMTDGWLNTTPYPFWGAAGGTPTGGGSTGLAPRAAVSIAHGHGLSWAASHHRLVVTCRLPGAGTCTVSASISAATARRLHLTPSRRTRALVLGHGSARLRRAGHASVTLGLGARTARALGRVRSLTITLSVRSTAPGARPREQVAHLTLGR